MKSKFSSLSGLKLRKMRIFTLVFGYLEACQEDSDYNACAEFMQEDMTKCLIDCGIGFSSSYFLYFCVLLSKQKLPLK